MECARLRSERWRRAHGIMPRRPAQKPWLAEGISRSTWYRRRKAAREREALVAMAARSQAMRERAEAFAAQLARDLERCVLANAAMEWSLRAHDRGEKRPDNFCRRTMAAIGEDEIQADVVSLKTAARVANL